MTLDSNNRGVYTPPEDRRFKKRKEMSPRKLGLGVAAAAVVVTLAALYGDKVWDSIYQGKSRDTLNGHVADLLNSEKESPENFPHDTLIPEDERSGENIMIAAHPSNQLSSPESGYREYFDMTLKPFLNALLRGTNVYIVITDENKDACLAVAKEMFPHLNFIILEMPYAGRGIEFIQDNVFATGATDKDGKFKIAKSFMDREVFRRDTDCFWEPWFAAMSKNESAEHAARMFTDDFLEEFYPERFSATDVDLRFDGGDLHVTRLPNGKTALVIGPKTIADNIILDKNICPPYKAVLALPKEDAVVRMNDIKESFKKRFGVDEVIILGDDHILRVNPDNSGKPDPIVPPLFFHTDMVVKTATNSSGEHIAFCTDYDPANFVKIMKDICDAAGCYNPDGSDAPIAPMAERMRDSVMFYLQSVQWQFSSLGYEVVKLPCGVSATLNYTNSVMFTGKGGEKFVIVPRYGIPQDLEAVAAYTKAGFKVLIADYSGFVDSVNEDVDWNNWWEKRSFFTEPDPDAGMNDNGSWHCRSVVLGSTAPTKKMAPLKGDKYPEMKKPKGWKSPHMSPNKHDSRQQAERGPNLRHKKRHIPPYQRQIYSPPD